ncbi:hypothetical protein SAMN05444586_100175 [Acinetobacter bohemicus]|uniref:Pentapeptide MXKDX repeat protein n=2 Tax=Acinetobacter bohemicus TaxID=1435036 RepID=A0A1I6NQX0_9GAMM|nr:hypothetical protein SAMN05444586_100175 [Acinetobacter bohemicus]
MLSATAFACPQGTTLTGGSGPNHKGGKCAPAMATTKHDKMAKQDKMMKHDQMGKQDQMMKHDQMGKQDQMMKHDQMWKQDQMMKQDSMKTNNMTDKSHKAAPVADAHKAKTETHKAVKTQ